MQHPLRRPFPMRGVVPLVAAGAVLLLLGGCDGRGRQEQKPARELSWKTFSLDRLDELGYDRAMVKIPPGNPWTAAKAELGRHLFFDRRLSKDHTISCAS